MTTAERVVPAELAALVLMHLEGRSAFAFGAVLLARVVLLTALFSSARMLF